MPYADKNRQAQYHREYQTKNVERILEYKRSYYAKHKKEIGKKRREWVAKNRERILKRRRKYYAENKMAFKQYQRRFRLKNLKEIKQEQAEYRKANREKCRNLTRQWRLKNTEHRKVYSRIYRRKRIQTDLDYLIRSRLRSRIQHAVNRNAGSKATPTMKLLGCSIKDFRIYIESKFEPEMTWGNYGDWHLDHIMPCAIFDLTKEEHQKRCFHFSNYQPLWKTDNLRKHCLHDSQFRLL